MPEIQVRSTWIVKDGEVTRYMPARDVLRARIEARAEQRRLATGKKFHMGS